MIFVSASSGVYVFNYNPGWIYVKKNEFLEADRIYAEGIYRKKNHF